MVSPKIGRTRLRARTCDRATNDASEPCDRATGDANDTSDRATDAGRIIMSVLKVFLTTRKQNRKTKRYLVKPRICRTGLRTAVDGALCDRALCDRALCDRAAGAASDPCDRAAGDASDRATGAG